VSYQFNWVIISILLMFVSIVLSVSSIMVIPYSVGILILAAVFYLLGFGCYVRALIDFKI